MHTKERAQLKNTSDFLSVCTLAQKYGIVQKLIEEVEHNIHSIVQMVLKLKSVNNEFNLAFIKFLKDMFAICFDKCQLPLRHELFDDRQ